MGSRVVAEDRPHARRKMILDSRFHLSIHEEPKNIERSEVGLECFTDLTKDGPHEVAP